MRLSISEEFARMRLFLPTASLFSCLCLSTLFDSKAFAWGEKGHRLVNRVAAETMESPLGEYLRKNTESFQKMAVVPDSVWKKKATYSKERFSHFFQWDIYSETELKTSMPILIQKVLEILNREELVKNGTAVWRVDQIYNLLVTAIENKKWVEVIQYAGTLGHYVGDLGQPMHVTEDYDGQSIGQKGIHAYFESTLISRQNADELHRKVYDAVQASKKSKKEEDDVKIVDLTWKQGKRALAKMPRVLEKFKKSDKPDDSGLVTDAVGGMADSAKGLAMILDRACEKAKRCSGFPKTVQTVADPEWIPVDIQMEMEAFVEFDH